MCDGYKNRILKLDLQGRILGTLGKAGKQPGNLYFSHHLAISKTGELYVAEVGNWRVQKFLLK